MYIFIFRFFIFIIYLNVFCCTPGDEKAEEEEAELPQAAEDQ